jgi:hypothetical protein
MPTDREIKQLVTTVAKKLEGDPNRPYQVRRRKPGVRNSKNEVVGGVQYDYRSITNMRTQPLGDKELNRLPEGLRDQTWRFVEVVPNNPGSLPSSQDEFLDFGDQFEYKTHWYEVKMINDWDLIQGCKAVFVE